MQYVRKQDMITIARDVNREIMGDGKRLPFVWRRYFARMFDMSLYTVFWSAILVFAFQADIMRRTSNLLTIVDIAAELLLMLSVEPVLLYFFASTPGKAIWGIRVKKADGTNLTYGEGLKRTFWMLARGMGFFIPLYSIYRMWVSYRECKEGRELPWDEGVYCTVKEKRWYRVAVYLVLTALVMGVWIIFTEAEPLPPNRGDLTVEQFAENYNFYAKKAADSPDYIRLDENGSWVKPDSNVIYLGQEELPEITYKTENGYLTGVFLIRVEDDRESWIYSDMPYMLTAAKAYAGAQEGAGKFSGFWERISTQMETGSFDYFHFTESGILYHCVTDRNGYEIFDGDSYGILVPEENAGIVSYRMVFSMTK